MEEIGSTIHDRLGNVVVMKTPLRIPRKGTGQGGGRTWVIMICDRDAISIMGVILINWTRIAMVEACVLDRAQAYWLSVIRETEKGDGVSVRTENNAELREMAPPRGSVGGNGHRGKGEEYSGKGKRAETRAQLQA